MSTALDEGTIYIGDNGRMFCGRLECAGASAHFTGRDISGQFVLRLTDADRQELAKYQLAAACEVCGAK